MSQNFRICQKSSKLLKISKSVINCPNCPKLSKIVQIVNYYQSWQKLLMLSKIVKKCQIVKYYRKNVKLSKVKSFGGPSSKVLVCQKEKIKVPGVYLMVPGGYLLAPGGYLMVPEGYLNKGVLLSCSGQLKTHCNLYLYTFWMFNLNMHMKKQHVLSFKQHQVPDQVQVWIKKHF